MSTTTIEIGATVNLGLAKAGFGELDGVVKTAIDSMGANFDELAAKSQAAATGMQSAMKNASTSVMASVEETSSTIKSANQQIISSNATNANSWNSVAESSIRASKALLAHQLAQQQLKDALVQAALAGDHDAAAMKNVAEATELASLAARQLAIEQKAAAAVADATARQMGIPGQRSAESFREGREAAMLFGETTGVAIPRGLQSVLATSELIGPVLSSAFGVFALVAFIDILSEIPDKIQAATDKLMGWDEAAKQTYQDLVHLNDARVKFLDDLELQKLHLSELGKTGAAKSAEELSNAGKEAKILEQRLLAATARERELNDQRNGTHPETTFDELGGSITVDVPNANGKSSEELKQIDEGLKAARQHADDLRKALEQLNEVKVKNLNSQFASDQAADAKKAMAELLRSWRTDLQKIRDAEDGTHQASKASEADFWRSKLALAQGNSKLYETVFHEMRAAEQADDRERNKEAIQSAKVLIASEEAKVGATKAGTEDRIQAERNVLSEMTRLGLQGTVEYQNQLKKVITAVREYEAEITKIAEISAQAQAASATRAIEAKRQQIEFEASIGKISDKERLAHLEQLENAEYEIKYRGLIRRMQLALTDPDKSPAEQMRIAAEIEAIMQQHELALTKIHQSAIQQRVKIFDQFFGHISQAFKTTIQGMIMGTQSFAQGMQNIWRNIVLEFVGMLAEQLVKWVAHKVAMLSIHVVTNEAMVASDAAAAAQSTSISFIASMKKIFMAAKVAAAHAYKSVMENVPFPVNVVLAPVTAAVVFAGVMALGALGSAKEGMFSEEEQLAFVHKNEMVLPAKFALGFQDLFRNFSPSASLAPPSSFGGRSLAMAGGGGGSIAVDARSEIKALDGASVARVMRRNRPALSREVKRAVRLANFGIPKGRF